MTVDGSFAADGQLILLSEQEMRLNKSLHGAGLVNVDTNNGNLIVAGTLSSDRLIRILVEGDRLEVTGVITAKDSVTID